MRRVTYIVPVNINTLKYRIWEDIRQASVPRNSQKSRTARLKLRSVLVRHVVRSARGRIDAQVQHSVGPGNVQESCRATNSDGEELHLFQFAVSLCGRRLGFLIKIK